MLHGLMISLVSRALTVSMFTRGVWTVIMTLIQAALAT